jgi:hypothetical protein
MTKKIIENITLLSIILIYFGYCNLYFFFKEFKIDIYNYISNSEILFSFLPTIVITAASFGYLIISLAINHNQRGKQDANNQEKEIENNKKNEQDLEIPKSKKMRFNISILKSPIIICFTIYTLLILVRFIIKHEMDYKDYELKKYSLLISFMIPILYYYVLIEFGNEFLKKYSFFIALFVIIFIGNQISEYRKCEAEEIKNGITNIEISFVINNKEVKTNKKLLLIGQTQSSIFLYDRSNKTSYVFDREKMEKLKIK